MIQFHFWKRKITSSQAQHTQLARNGVIHELSLAAHCPPHVPDPAEEVVGAVPERDEGVRAEEDRLRSVGRLRELGEHDARHTRLDKLLVQIYKHGTWGYHYIC